MAVHKILFASLLLFLLIESSHGATKERLFSELKKGALEVTAKPSREGADVGMYISLKTIHLSLLQIVIPLGVQICDFALVSCSILKFSEC